MKIKWNNVYYMLGIAPAFNKNQLLLLLFHYNIYKNSYNQNERVSEDSAAHQII